MGLADRSRSGELSRRAWIKGSGAAGMALLMSGASGCEEEPCPECDCQLTPTGAEGPFYVDVDLVRSDITEGRPGKPLTLELDIVRALDCSPIRDAVVEVWQADAAGLYSIEEGQTFMRGTQISDELGRVRFETVYPGWYLPRTPHVHFKVWLGDAYVLGSEVYFPDPVSDAVYLESPYAERGERPTTNDQDLLYALSRDAQAVTLRVADRDDGGLVGSLIIGVLEP